IRDKVLHLFEEFGLGDAYRAIKGLPRRPFRLSDLFLSRGDPEAWAYWNTRDAVTEFAKRIGKATGGGGAESPRTLPLYYLRQALRMGDEQAAVRFLLE